MQHLTRPTTPRKMLTISGLQGVFLGSDLRPQGWDFGDETGLVGAGEKFFQAGPPSFTEIEG